MKKFTLIGWCLIAHVLSAQLVVGPMVSYVEMKEACIWVQSKEAASIQIQYWNSTNTGVKMKSETVKTQPANGYVASFVLGYLHPGNTYYYEVMVNNKPAKTTEPTVFRTKSLWQWRGDAPDFTFAAGSCHYQTEPAVDRPGEPYGGDYQIFNSIADKKPDFMLWLGDNVYLREVDWSSKSGIMHRYAHTRSAPELQKLLTVCPHYAIIDDHDFGPNDSDRGYFLKDESNEVFRLYWPSVRYGQGTDKALYQHMQWSDCDFFLLDNRYHRTPNAYKDRTGCTVLGPTQLQWLKDALINSRGVFKFIAVGGQVLNPLPAHENYINVCASERDSILAFVQKNKIRGVVFLSGDRHHSEISRMEREGAYPLHDITISPLSSRANAKFEEEKNAMRVEGSGLGIRNFGTIRVSGPKNARQLTLKYFDSQGAEKFSYTIKADELK